MTFRCGCPDDGDPIVFGRCRVCFPEPYEVDERPYEVTLDEDERRGY